MNPIKKKVDKTCDKIMEYSLYALVFFLPSSKSMIEVCATVAVFAWIIKKLNNINIHEVNFKTPRPFFIATALSLLLLIPIAFVMISTITTQHIHLSLKTPVPLFPAIIISFILLIPVALIMLSSLTTDRMDYSVKIPILLFIDINIITSILTTRHIDISFGAFFFKILEYVFIFFIMAETINTPKRIINILISLLVSSFVMGLDGIFQQITAFDFFRKFPLYAGKVSATMQFPNDFGTYLATVLPISVSLVINKVTGKKMQFGLFLLCALLATCLLLTQSRAAWLGFIIGFLFVAFFSGRKRFSTALLLLIILCIILVNLFGPPLIKEQIKSFAKLSSDVSSIDRIIIWKTGWRMFMNAPLFGHGFCTFMRVFEEFKPKEYSEIVYAHNCYLQMAAETGFLGLLAFLWFLGGLFLSSIKKIFKFDDVFLKAATIGVAGGLLAYLVESFFDTSLYSLTLAALFWAIAGLAATRITAE